MLEYMRKNANSTLVWLIVGAIVVVFIFFGYAGGRGGLENISVNGEEISQSEFEQIHQALSRNVYSRGGGGGGPDLEQRIRQEAVNQAIGRQLVRQFAANMGLTPSDRAVGRSIASVPEFQVDGRFDRAVYEAAFSGRRARLTKAGYEEDHRRAMMDSRASTLVAGLSQIFLPELLDQYHFQEDLLAFDYVFFPSAAHRVGLNPGEDDLSAFFARNQERWREPARMVLEYVDIRPADLPAEGEVGDEELRVYYAENSQRFPAPESVELSQILFSFPRLNPDEAEKQETLARAEAAYARALSEDFGALARELSDDPVSAAEDGRLSPPLVRGSTFQALEEAAFSAAEGEISRPVETDLGYHVLKIGPRRAAGFQPFEELRDSLESELKRFRARERAVRLLEDLLIRSESNPKLSEAAASMGLSAQMTESFTELTAPDFFEKDQAAIQAAFSVPLGKVGPTLEKEEHLVLYVPVERQDSRIPDFSELRAVVREAWIGQEAARLARQDAQDFLKKAGESDWESASAALEADGPTRRGRSDGLSRALLMSMTSPPFDRTDPLEFTAAVSSAARAGDLVPLTVFGEENGRAGCFALRLAELSPADESLFAGDMGRTFQSIMSLRRAPLYRQVWMMELYRASEARIVIPKGYVGQ
ncbi:MAG: SurA N-terminal domain-containing protein [Candidatus Adiutrix sp.]|jgi:peptidyl-prolyl cis-trans isomerase D|nr:SurA N-terminal domain-containing protein [Candidatus Adiutrix sp.]